MARDFVNVYVGLGANLGNARQSLESSILAIQQLPETLLVGCSSFYQSAPFQADGPDYFNAVVHLQTRLNACDLLHAFQHLNVVAQTVQLKLILKNHLFCYLILIYQI